MTVRGYYVTGTDTDVGKTRATAALAIALRSAGYRPSIVKLAQTGVPAGGEGDAAVAAKLSGVDGLECARFALPADPWSAALAQGAQPLTVRGLCDRLAPIADPIVAEGSGGAAVPLNASESISDVAAAAGLAAIVVVGLRLGCISHTLLTLDYLRARAIPAAGIVLSERWEPSTPSYREQVARALGAAGPILGVMPHDADAARSAAGAAALFHHLAKDDVDTSHR